ncbi:MAG: NAD-dependent epimerase/dehydratase family protein, partial [Limisphaerales bacterium]
MRVLITGHLGYIGTVLTAMLLNEGHEVVGYDSDLYRESSFSCGMVEVPAINKDIRDAEARDLDGFDAVLHLAGLSSEPLGELDPKLTMEINFEAAVRLADLARKVGVKRFLFSSSCHYYGGGDEFQTEESLLCPKTPYAKSKVLAEQQIQTLANEKFSPVFLRIATAFGISPRHRFDLVVNNLTARAYTTGKVHLICNGSEWWPLAHVEDICRAFTAALKTDRDVVHNQAFNVGRTDSNYRTCEIAEMVKEVVPNSEVRLGSAPSPDRRYMLDCS